MNEIIEIVDKLGIAGICIVACYYVFREWRREQAQNKIDSAKERELFLNLLVKELQEQRFLTNDLVKTLRENIKGKPKEKEE